MTLVKFNRRPFESSFNNLVDELFNDMPVFSKRNGFGSMNGFAPVNIKETEDSYSLEVVAPGYNKEDFKVDLENDLLTISAEKKEESKSESDSHQNVKQIRREYAYRSFKRSFTLDEKIDADRIEAKYVNGILTLNLPKKEEVKQASKQINIQ